MIVVATGNCTQDLREVGQTQGIPREDRYVLASLERINESSWPLYCTVAVKPEGASGVLLTVVFSKAPMDSEFGRVFCTKSTAGVHGLIPPLTQEVVPFARARLPAFKLKLSVLLPR